MNTYYTDLDGRSYPALKRVRTVDSEKVVTWERQVTDANVLTIEAGTNGYHGCRTGHGRHADHGCRTFLRISDSASTDIKCDVEDGYLGNAEEITITLGGDAELRTIIEALKWMASILEVQILEAQIVEVQSEIVR